MRHRVDVDLDHAGVGGDLQQLEARVSRGRVALQHDLHAQLLGGSLHGGEQAQVVFQLLQRRHEDIQHARFDADRLGLGPAGAARVTHLDAQCGAGQPVGRLFGGRGAVAGVGASASASVIASGGSGSGGCGGGGVSWALPGDRRDGGRRAGGSQRIAGGQGGLGHREVGLVQVGEIGFADPGQRIQRQAKSHGRVAGHQVQALVAHKPGAGAPVRAGFVRALYRLDRQHVTDFAVELLLEHAAQAHAFHLVAKLGIERVHIDRQAAFAPQVVPDVLIGAEHVGVAQDQLRGQRPGEALGVGAGVVGGDALVGKQGRVAPNRLAVGAPVDVERPARQLLARVPLALAEMQKAALAVVVAQFVHQFGGQAALGRAHGVDVPLWCIAVVHRHKGGFPAHGQAHVATGQRPVHLLAQGHYCLPLVVGVGLGHARGFQQARYRHVVAELDLALVNAAFDRRRP